MEGHARIRGTVASAMQDLQLALAGDSKSEITVDGSTITVERRYYPGWVWVVCVLLFPIGLLALLTSKRSDRGIVAVSDAGDGVAQLRMSGTFYKQSHAAIDRVIVANS